MIIWFRGLQFGISPNVSQIGQSETKNPMFRKEPEMSPTYRRFGRFWAVVQRVAILEGVVQRVAIFGDNLVQRGLQFGISPNVSQFGQSETKNPMF